MSCSRVSERVAVTTTRSSWVVDAVSGAVSGDAQAANAAMQDTVKTKFDGARWRKGEVMSTVLESSSGRRQRGLAGQNRWLAR
jgi:uncharacterized protein (DUF2141 family)